MVGMLVLCKVWKKRLADALSTSFGFGFLRQGSRRFF